MTDNTENEVIEEQIPLTKPKKEKKPRSEKKYNNLII